MAVRIGPRFIISNNDVERVSVDFTDHLDSGELLTGTPTVAVSPASGLAASSAALNAATYTPSYDDDRTVAISAAAQFTLTASTAGTYTVTVTVSTDAAAARTFIRDLIIEVL